MGAAVGKLVFLEPLHFIVPDHARQLSTSAMPSTLMNSVTMSFRMALSFFCRRTDGAGRLLRLREKAAALLGLSRLIHSALLKTDALGKSFFGLD
jgi:hypothetical protein